MYTTNWCHYCKVLKPVIEEYSKGRSDIEVKYVDIELTPPSDIYIVGVPTLRIDAGRQFYYIGGADSKQFYNLMRAFE